MVRRYAPFDAGIARERVLSLKGVRMLQGYRGQPACDLDVLASAISKLSWLIADHANMLCEVEINPLIVGAANGALAVDAVLRRV